MFGDAHTFGIHDAEHVLRGGVALFCQLKPVIQRSRGINLPGGRHNIFNNLRECSLCKDSKGEDHSQLQ